MLTITQLVTRIKHLLEEEVTLRDVWVEGEVSNFKQAVSGHCYFTLKDAAAAIPCVMWRADARQLTRLPANGEQVSAHGGVSVYQTQGKVQFYVDQLQPAGLGQLYQEFELLKERLTAEGLFEPERKRALPEWPQRIGVVTSRHAAALRDILSTIAARYPLAEVLLAPSAVQGTEAPLQLVSALTLLNHWASHVEPLDVIILARGGGSIEELWAFNDERVVRAVTGSTVPVVSGVGHETDFTLVDFAVDARAPTPTGAAALATPDRAELAVQVGSQRIRIAGFLRSRLVAEQGRLTQTRRSLRLASPTARIASYRQQVDELNQRGTRQMLHRVELRRAQLDGAHARLSTLNPAAVLRRGYAVVRNADNDAIITSTAQVRTGDRLRVTVSDGEFESNVI